MPYTVDKIQMTLARAYSLRVPKAELRAELDKEPFLPEMGQMIAVANDPQALDTSDRYGFFEGIDGENGRYIISTGRFRFARVLTADEIARCY